MEFPIFAYCFFRKPGLMTVYVLCRACVLQHMRDFDRVYPEYKTPPIPCEFCGVLPTS